MNNFMKFCLVSSLLALNFCATTTAFAETKKGTSSVAEIALFEGENRLQTLVEGAKKEGELTLYNSMPVEDITPIIDAFTKKYGVKIKIWRSSSENVLQRTIAEARAGRFDVDMVENNSPEMEALHREKLLQQVKSPYHADLMPQAIPAHKEWVGHTVDIFVQAYNTDKVKKEELPKTYQDLLDPKWKDRLGIEAEDQSWFATLVQALGPEKGPQLFKDIVATNGISVRKGHTLLTKMVASGEVPLALTIYNYKPAELKDQGAPIDWFVIPPAIAQFRGIGLLEKAPHPHAAMLFYDFLLSESPAILLRKHYVPTNAKFESPLSKLSLKFIDPVLALDTEDSWRKTYEAIFIKGQKR